MWKELCNLYKGKQKEAIRSYTICRVEDEPQNINLTPGEDVNLHICKTFSLEVELANLQHKVKEHTMFDILLKNLPDQIEFERLKSSIYYGADPIIYTAARVRELVFAASARQREFRGNALNRKREVGFTVKSTDLAQIWCGPRCQTSKKCSFIKKDSIVFHMRKWQTSQIHLSSKDTESGQSWYVEPESKAAKKLHNLAKRSRKQGRRSQRCIYPSDSS